MQNSKISIWVHILVWSIVLFPVSALAQPYFLNQSVEIITEPIQKEEFAPIEWRLDPSSLKNGLTGIEFFRKESGKFIGRLVFSGPANDISWEGMDISQNMIQSKDSLIVSGVPIPCDVLPVAKLFSFDNTMSYEFRMHAGSRTFVEQIQMSSIAISFEEARNKGWIKCAGEPKTELRLIKAVNLRTGELMVQQLWGEDSSWWVYEETPYHTSWRVR